MLRYAYTGRAATGPVTGEIEGPDAQGVAALLLDRGITPLKIEALDGRAHAAAATAASASAASSSNPAALPGGAFARWMVPPVSSQDLMLFSRQLHTLLRSGVPILRALAGLQESAPGIRMKATLGQIRRSLESGVELSMTLAQHSRVFDSFFIAMVRIGEMTGRLDEVFMQLFKHIEFDVYMKQQVKSATRYPMFVCIAMTGAIGVINVMVIPAFAGVFKSFNSELPLATRILLGMSKFTLEYGWLLAIAVAGAIFAFRSWLATPKGALEWDRIRLKIPLAGKIVQKATLARLARSFSLALRAGVPIEQALGVVAQTVDNHYISRKVDGIRDAVTRGDTILRAATATGVFTPVVLQMIAVGEETGALEQLMEDVAELYTNEVQYELKTLAQQLEPILIVFIGILVLILALGVFLPMWDLGRVALKR